MAKPRAVPRRAGPRASGEGPTHRPDGRGGEGDAGRPRRPHRKPLFAKPCPGHGQRGTRAGRERDRLFRPAGSAGRRRDLRAGAARRAGAEAAHRAGRGCRRRSRTGAARDAEGQAVRHRRSRRRDARGGAQNRCHLYHAGPFQRADGAARVGRRMGWRPPDAARQLSDAEVQPKRIGRQPRDQPQEGADPVALCRRRLWLQAGDRARSGGGGAGGAASGPAGVGRDDPPAGVRRHDASVRDPTARAAGSRCRRPAHRHRSRGAGVKPLRRAVFRAGHPGDAVHVSGREPRDRSPDRAGQSHGGRIGPRPGRSGRRDRVRERDGRAGRGRRGRSGGAAAAINIPDKDPSQDIPFSSHKLADALRQGAEALRLGPAQRPNQAPCATANG